MLNTAQNVLLCKKILDNFPNEMTTEVLKPAVNQSFVKWLCHQSQKIFQGEPNVIETNSCVHIVGDIHGQFYDLISIFKAGGVPIKERYIFLGDYIDRGENSLEVIILLLILKCTYPNHIILLRGNHESRYMAKTYGFSKEVDQKLNPEISQKVNSKGSEKVDSKSSEYIQFFCETFDKMPLCAIVDKTIFCVHGGISKYMNSIKDINEIQRFGDIPDNGLMCDLLWSDPSNACKEWEKSDRCDTNLWGLEPAKKFLKDNNLTAIIRGHQVVEDGYKYEFYPNRSVITVFSSKGNKNKAVFMTINKSLPYKFTEIHCYAHEINSSSFDKDSIKPKSTNIKNNNVA